MATSQQLARRLRDLEVYYHPASQGQAEHRREQAERQEWARSEWARTATDLARTMAEEHLALVLATMGVGPDCQPCEPLTDPGALCLSFWFDSLVDNAECNRSVPHGKRLALPPAVAEVLLRVADHDRVKLDGCCNTCRLPLPWRLYRPELGEGWGMASGPRFFETCPQCGSSDVISGYFRMPKE